MNRTHRSLLRVLLLLAFFIVTPMPNSAHNAIVTDGDLDPSFGVGGKVITDFPTPVTSTASAIALQSDGKLVMAGTTQDGFGLMRFQADGSLDTSFGYGGKITTAFNDRSGANAVAIQADGKILVAGQVNTGDNGDFAVVRYTNDGQLDPSFGAGGKVTTDFGGFDRAAALGIQSDGRVLAAGTFGDGGNAYFAVARYNLDGSLDMSFGNAGKLTTTFTGCGALGYSLVVQTNGEFIVAGRNDNCYDYDFALARYNGDGSLDTSFGQDGKVTTDFGSHEDAAAVAIQGDGKIVAAGNAGYYTRFALARYNPDGSLDSSFGSGGKVTSDFGDLNGAWAVAIQGDGKIIAAGGAGTFVLARYNTNGDLDPTFGDNGKVMTGFGGGSARAFGLSIQGDGRVVAAGTAQVNGTDHFAMARYNPDGSLDSSFGSNGTVATAFTASSARAAGLAIQSDGRIVAVGSDGQDFGLARYQSNGSLDSSFGTDGKVTTDFGGEDDQARAVAIQSDGKIVAAGNAQFGAYCALARYNLDGSLDSSFGTNGKITTSCADSSEVRAMTIQQDGKIVVAGWGSYNRVGDFMLVRYHTDGTLDSSFGHNGIVTTGFDSDSGATSLAIQSDAKIVAAGQTVGPTNYNIVLARYNTDGSLDQSFGTGGKVATGFAGQRAGAVAVLIQENTRIVVAGYTDNGSKSTFVLVRYDSDGSRDGSFGQGGTVTTEFPTSAAATALGLQADGKIVVAGSVGTAPATDYAVVRYKSDGSLDGSFGRNGVVTVDFGGTDNTAALAVQSDGKIVVAGTSSGAFALARLTATLTCSWRITDVRPADPFYAFITCLTCRDIVNGYADASFRPTNPVIRGQLAKFVANAAGYTEPISPGLQTFTDVSPSDPFWLYIERVYAHGIISGYSNSSGSLSFHPGNPVTRSQIAKFVANAAAYHDAIPRGQQTFADVQPADPFWIYIERAYLHSVISGHTCGLQPREPCDAQKRPYFLATNNVTRGQTAKFIANAFFPNCQVPAP